MSAEPEHIAYPNENERAFIAEQRVARMATVDGHGEPSVVPICYVYDGTRFYTPIDEKPKQLGKTLKRVRNVEETGTVALVIDRYDEDWSRLVWVMVRGRATLLHPDDPGHATAVMLLRERYPQYRDMALERAPIIAIAPTHFTGWGALEAHPTS
ncbi:MAG TPA: TIGR03668 family PPOX class F420-dependent oxidoreductase [Nitrolancea sp.]|nr:TIGR03668 family PPOX class F420-dependent oxidoreductase [Nitrolancea sp.]